jgi:hypothetical protein
MNELQGQVNNSDLPQSAPFWREKRGTLSVDFLTKPNFEASEFERGCHVDHGFNLEVYVSFNTATENVSSTTTMQSPPLPPNREHRFNRKLVQICVRTNK